MISIKSLKKENTINFIRYLSRLLGSISRPITKLIKIKKIQFLKPLSNIIITLNNIKNINSLLREHNKTRMSYKSLSYLSSSLLIKKFNKKLWLKQPFNNNIKYVMKNKLIKKINNKKNLPTKLLKLQKKIKLKRNKQTYKMLLYLKITQVKLLRNKSLTLNKNIKNNKNKRPWNKNKKRLKKAIINYWLNFLLLRKNKMHNLLKSLFLKKLI